MLIESSSALQQTDYVVDVCTTTDELRALEGDWWQLYRESVCGTPFQSPAWLVPWWECFQPGDLRVLAVRRQAQLVGLFPLWLQTADDPPKRRWLLLGMGSSDYLDGLVHHQHQSATIEALWRWLLNHRDEWDLLDLHQLPANSPLLAAAKQTRMRGVPEITISAQDCCPVLPLPHGARLESIVPANQSKKVRYYRRRLPREGAVAWETADEENLERLLQELNRLHTARWRERGDEGVLAEQDVQRFHALASPQLLRSNLLRMHALYFQQQLVAVLYALADRRTYYYYISGFDPQWRRFSPGVLVVAQAIEAAADEGCASFDFLRGSEAYKYEWGARNTWTHRCCLPAERLHL